MRSGFVKSRYILAAVAVAWAGGVITLHLAYVQPSIDQQAEQIERETAADWLRLANDFLRIRRNRMLRLTAEWAKSGKLAGYLKGVAPLAVGAETSAEPPVASPLGSVLVCDRNAKLLSAWKRGEGGSLVEDDRMRPGLDLSNLRLLRLSERVDRFSGVGSTPLGLALFAQCAVRAAGQAAAAGYVVTVRPVDDVLLAELSAEVGATVSIHLSPPLPAGKAVPAFGQAVWREVGHRFKGVQVFRDSTGAPAGYLTAEGEAGASYRHARAVQRALTFTLVWGSVFALLMIVVIHVVVSGPTARLLKRVQRLRAGQSDVDLSIGLRGEALALARQFEEALAHIARASETDSLTGTANRRSFQEAFVREYGHARRYGRPLSLAVMDIDFLKAANDVLGHQMGDVILQVFARVIKENTRASDTVARLGGDEFAVLMPETTAADAAVVAERIRTCIASKSIGSGDVKLSPTISGGVLDLNTPGADSPEALFNLADTAMYTAKRTGRNRIVRAEELEEVSALEAANDQAKVSHLCKQMAGLDARFKRLFVEAIGGFVSALEARDAHTANHSAKVSRCAVLIARQMNLPDRTVEHIGRAAMLIDIGKIGLPDSILLKNGPLSPQEWELVKRHTLVSVRIMEGMEFLDQEIPSVRYHHERYDGTGYPEGLAGSAIPVGSRILALADAFTAMTSSRLYRDAMSLEDALAEIRRNSGAQFDPAVVESFLKVAEQQDLNNEDAAVVAAPSAT